MMVMTAKVNFRKILLGLAAVAALVLVTAIGKVLIHVVARMPMGRSTAES